MTYDYIIIGAGSAGCVLANRLANNLNVKILLLEKGKNDSNPWIHMVGGYQYLMNNSSITKKYTTEPVKNLNHRTTVWPRGEVVGGSSSVNGMIHMRGYESDFNSWKNDGNEGWGWSDVLPFFKKIENHEISDETNHGANGPIKVSVIKNKHKINTSFIKACNELGYPTSKDLNGSSKDGAGYMHLACYNGKRFSASVGYLNNLKKKIDISLNSQVVKINFKNNKAVSVTYIKNNSSFEAIASKEIILSAGAINSPKILQLSGVGCSSLLKSHNIEVIKDLPGVGKNLQDHLQINCVYKLKNLITINNINESLIKKVSEVIKFIFRKKGYLVEGATHVGLFTKNTLQNKKLSMQYLLTLASGDLLNRKLDNFPGITISFYQSNPLSRGDIKIKSAKYNDDPMIDANYLDHEVDRMAVVEGLRFVRKLCKTNAMKDFILTEHIPGKSSITTNELLEYAKNIGKTNYHPSGTCKMGNDLNSVVDKNLNVRGISSLKVVDASIMPSIVSGNINATVLMIAEKASNLIIENEKKKYVQN